MRERLLAAAFAIGFGFCVVGLYEISRPVGLIGVGVAICVWAWLALAE